MSITPTYIPKPLSSKSAHTQNKENVQFKAIYSSKGINNPILIYNFEIDFAVV